MIKKSDMFGPRREIKRIRKIASGKTVPCGYVGTSIATVNQAKPGRMGSVRCAVISTTGRSAFIDPLTAFRQSVKRAIEAPEPSPCVQVNASTFTATEARSHARFGAFKMALKRMGGKGKALKIWRAKVSKKYGSGWFFCYGPDEVVLCSFRADCGWIHTLVPAEGIQIGDE